MFKGVCASVESRSVDRPNPEGERLCLPKNKVQMFVGKVPPIAYTSGDLQTILRMNYCMNGWTFRHIFFKFWVAVILIKNYIGSKLAWTFDILDFHLAMLCHDTYIISQEASWNGACIADDMLPCALQTGAFNRKLGNFRPKQQVNIWEMDIQIFGPTLGTYDKAKFNWQSQWNVTYSDIFFTIHESDLNCP